MVGARIAEIMAIGAERADVTAEEVIRELKALGSGSAATLSGSTDIIGMLVGASTGSLIQDARTQINAIMGLSNLIF
jgi:hypothetical protein